MFTEINVDNIINVSVYVNSTMEEELDSVTITIDPYTLTKEDVAVGVDVIQFGQVLFSYVDSYAGSF
ncbi:hypothetical protein GEA64_05420 [Photorhabdus khanii]|uniref:Uncharacterized protein n=2 Tax=Photorhabdus khanii TaxID=1004150 RepID=A0A7C9KEE6_9GAMM|nr:hypothetical protein [Photorhabdus khanii]MQL47464.1 hypothetical protein [Photorhabdus khanii]